MDSINNVIFNNRVFKVARSELGTPAVSAPTGTPAIAGVIMIPESRRVTRPEDSHSSGACRRLLHQGTLYLAHGRGQEASMTEETARGVISILWVVGVLAFYAALVVGVWRLVRWLGKTIEHGVQASRYQTMRAQGKSDAEIQAVLEEHVLERHWWLMPVAAVVIVFLILPPGGIFLGLMFLIRLARNWPHLKQELDERARLRAERIAAREDQRR